MISKPASPLSFYHTNIVYFLNSVQESHFYCHYNQYWGRLSITVCNVFRSRSSLQAHPLSFC